MKFITMTNMGVDGDTEVTVNIDQIKEMVYCAEINRTEVVLEGEHREDETCRFFHGNLAKSLAEYNESPATFYIIESKK